MFLSGKKYLELPTKNSSMYTNLSVTFATDFLKNGDPVGLPHNMDHCPDMKCKTFACFWNTLKKGLQ